MAFAICMVLVMRGMAVRETVARAVAPSVEVVFPIVAFVLEAGRRVSDGLGRTKLAEPVVENRLESVDRATVVKVMF